MSSAATPDYHGCKLCGQQRPVTSHGAMSVQFKPTSATAVQVFINGVYSGILTFEHPHFRDAFLDFYAALEGVTDGMLSFAVSYRPAPVKVSHAPQPAKTNDAPAEQVKPAKRQWWAEIGDAEEAPSAAGLPEVRPPQA